MFQSLLNGSQNSIHISGNSLEQQLVLSKDILRISEIWYKDSNEKDIARIQGVHSNDRITG